MPDTHPQDLARAPASGPFSLDDNAAYGRWRAHKLAHYPRRAEEQSVAIDRLGQLTAAQRDEIAGACRRANFALYRTDPQTPATMDDLRAFGQSLGLVRFDRHLWALQLGIAALRREADGGRGDYIPYTDRPMNWHTDGYYNAFDATVRGVIMHCVSPAAEGGDNWVLDPEMVYISVRDSHPAYIEALMQPDAMTIPENALESGAERPAVSGPVFSVNQADGTLHMRYTSRTRSIQWKEDMATRNAVAFLEELLTMPAPYAFRVRLRAGQGIVCNNVLHNREGFSDDPATQRERLLWRARYRDRIAGTVAEQLMTD